MKNQAPSGGSSGIGVFGGSRAGLVEGSGKLCAANMNASAVLDVGINLSDSGIGLVGGNE